MSNYPRPDNIHGSLLDHIQDEVDHALTQRRTGLIGRVARSHELAELDDVAQTLEASDRVEWASLGRGSNDHGDFTSYIVGLSLPPKASSSEIVE